MLNRSDSPWYPSVRLFRQKTLHEGWKNTIAEVALALSGENLGQSLPLIDNALCGHR
jgi:hypothetical protein